MTSPSSASMLLLFLCTVYLSCSNRGVVEASHSSPFSWRRPTKKSLSHWGGGAIHPGQTRICPLRPSPHTRSCYHLEALRGGADAQEEGEDKEDEVAVATKQQENTEESSPIPSGENDEDDESNEEEVESAAAQAENEQKETEAQDVDEDQYDDEYDTEDDDDEEEEAEEEETISTSISSTEKEYDETFMASPQLQIFVTLGAMMLGKKVDLFTPSIVRLIRFLFIAQILFQQGLILYIRILAKKKNDRTPLTVDNPLSAVLQSQLQKNQELGSNDMVKNLASSFLSSQTTFMEYDIKQAGTMQGGVVFTILFMWLMHFKMGKVEPLLIQVATSLIQLGFHPLFQVYILGRNLERPFKTAPSPVEQLFQSQTPKDPSSEQSNEDEEVEENNDTGDEEQEDAEESEDNETAEEPDTDGESEEDDGMEESDDDEESTSPS